MLVPRQASKQLRIFRLMDETKELIDLSKAREVVL